jgi:hypothetical protein
MARRQLLHYKFKIGGATYEVREVPNSQPLALTVWRRRNQRDEWVQLERPELAYETPAGAFYAILQDLERRRV